MSKKTSNNDLMALIGLSLLMIVLALVFQVHHLFSAIQILPYALLWAALCFGGFVYRRWAEQQAALPSESIEVVLSPDAATWQWDIVHDAVVWSESLYEIFGVEKESFKVSYPAFLQSIHIDDRLQVEESIAQCLRENTGFSLDFRIVTPTGEIRIVHGEGDVSFLGDRPVKMTGTISDITEFKQDEIYIRDRFGMLQSLIDAIPVPVYHKDQYGIYEGCNKAFEDFVHSSKKKIIGKTTHDILPPAMAKAQDDMDKALFRQGGSQTYETSINSVDGVRLDVIYHKALLTKNDGSLSGLIGTILDISDRKQMEIALKESENRFRNIAQSASDWFWETDEENRFFYMSDNIEDNLGVSVEAILGKSRMEIAGQEEIQENQDKWDAHLDDLAHHRAFRGLVYSYISAEGKQLYVSVNGVPVFDDEGQFRGYRGTGSDISHQMRVEDALRKSEERHRIFAADVAHELRTPLAVLRTHLDNLDDTMEVQSLRHDVDNMSRMVTQLLAITRLEIFTPEIALVEVDLREACRNVATMIAPIAIKDHRSIELTGGEEPVVVKGVSGALEQAIRNLVENAIRYSARGTVITLNVDSRPVPTIRVIDRGRGIALEQREHIFQRFKRADRRSEGTGLGLSIVKRAVESHDAEIEVEDTPGGGATFVIRFPASNV